MPPRAGRTDGIGMTKLLICATCLCVICTPAWSEDRLVTVDARTLSGRLVSVSAETITLATEAGTQSVRRADVAQIFLLDDKAPPPPDCLARAGATVVVTAAGDALPADDLKLSADRLTFSNPTLGATSVPVAQTTAIYLRHASLSPRAIEQRCRRMKVEPGAQDVLLLAKQRDNWLIVRGELGSIDPQSITIRWKDADHTVRRRMVPAIYPAATGRKVPVCQGVLTGLDGTTVAFTALALNGNDFTLELPGIGRRKVSRKAVATITFRSDRVADLASLKPTDVKEYGFFDRVFHYRVNRAVGGGALRLGGQTYASGLGLHSFCELSWDLGGAYSSLVARVGIDDAVRPAGNAQLTFLADGKPLTEPLHLTGKDAPQIVRLKLAKARRLTIRVDFGPDGLDVSDHVNIAAARLIK